MDEIVDRYFPEYEMGFYLVHYGTKRHSGRYPWGSGENPYQHAGDWLNATKSMKKSGMTEKEIAGALLWDGASSADLRAYISIANAENRSERVAQAIKLKEHGYSNTEIARRMDTNESNIRNWLKPDYQQKQDATQKLADTLKQRCDEVKYLDIGEGVERQLNVSPQRMNTAVAMLEAQGYKKQYVKVEQATNPGKETTIKVLTKNDIPWKEVNQNKQNIKSFDNTWIDNGKTNEGLRPPVSISSSRVRIRYSDEKISGKMKDGEIEINPKAKDLSLGTNNYCQVRIMVDGTHYIKGMAVYGDPKDFKKGEDIIFNTNKNSSKSKMDVLKPIKDDPSNPFGSTIKSQLDYIGKDGKKHQSPINIVNDDENWETWSRTLASQFLSKQPVTLAKQQLKKDYDIREKEYQDICNLTNPAIKKHLLKNFADDCDSAAVDLKAAALPRQATHVILPVPSLKDNEIFAPNYKNGEEVVLVRYPHAGSFESPRLIVNNKNPEARKVIGTTARTAVGINHKVAEQLSGADFDGDTVVVIPTKGIKIKTQPPLKGLQGFDPQERYPAYEGMPKVGPKTGFHKQREMGIVSNLISDMTIRGASEDELARAVRHSMVVIDAEKHNLNYKQSYIDNNIEGLKNKYQPKDNKKGYGGASTLISSAKSVVYTPEREDRYSINPNTGEKIWKETGRYWTEKKTLKDGTIKEKIHQYQTKTTAMDEAKDAMELSSGSRIETVYGNYANSCKSLGNRARKEYMMTPDLRYSPSAKKTYSKEVESLNEKLNNSLLNAPRERRAQALAGYCIKEKVNSDPSYKEDKDKYKKMKARTLQACRERVGANGKKYRINITPKEWEAIQAGAISNSKLQKIIMKADQDQLRKYATPRKEKPLVQQIASRAKSLAAKGYTQAEIADQLGVSTSTVVKALKN